MEKYIEERNRKTFELLDRAKAELPPFASRFFLGLSQTTQPLTRLGYAYDLKVFFDFLSVEVEEFAGKKRVDWRVTDLDTVEVLHIELFVDWLSTRQNNERARMRKLSCLRSFFAYYFKKGEIQKNIMPNIDLPKLYEKSIVRLDQGEVKKIIAEASDGEGLTPGQKRFHGKLSMRDTVILTFFLSTGVRVSELVGLNVGDIDLKTASFKITRKGGNESVLYMSDELSEVMAQYLCSDEATPLPDRDSPLFVGIRGERLGVRAVQNLVKKYAGVASPLKKISPHKLRSTYGTNLYRATGDIYVVADVLGHRDVNTTKKHYAALSDDIRKQAAKKVSLFDNPSDSENA